MVATQRRIRPIRRRIGAFSPLFIAAMVATIVVRVDAKTFRHFQSAFHRGNGCYMPRQIRRRARRLSVRFSSRQWLLHLSELMDMVQPKYFQSAFHRGNGCYYGARTGKRRLLLLSVRFSSRQWLLLGHYLRVPDHMIAFQSAFHRGNGCYNFRQRAHQHHCGLSVRFSSRQWLLLV